MDKSSKICTKCKIEKPISEFSLQKKINKHRAFCKLCERESTKKYRETHKEQLRETSRKWRIENPEKMKAAKDRWNKANAEHLKKWQSEYIARTKEQRAEAWANWYDKNRLYVSAKHKENWSNPQLREKILERGRNYKRNNANKLRHYGHVRRAIMYQNGVFLITDKDTQRILNSVCFYCGAKDSITIDHVIPIARGGTHGIGNLLPACFPCNASKNKKTIMEWRMWKMRTSEYIRGKNA